MKDAPKLVIIESPLSPGNGRTVEQHEEYARDCLYDCLRRGEAPLASHLLYTQVLDDRDPHQRRQGIEAGLAWYNVLSVAQISHRREIKPTCVVYVDHGISGGMLEGIARARELGCDIQMRRLSRG
jgi:hypothetical protein